MAAFLMLQYRMLQYRTNVLFMIKYKCPVVADLIAD